MRPNILFFFTDQLRFDAIASHNNPHIKTPNLDRLIERGTTFTNAYTPSPVCVAARCSMHYGQYPIHTGCWSNDSMPDDGRTSYVEALTQAGYVTHAIGKCHFTPDPYALRGFQHREYQEEMGFEQMEKEDYLNFLIQNGYKHAIEPHGVRSEMYYIPQPSRLPQRLHPSQWVADRSKHFIEHQTQDQPWYLFSSFIHPHPPFAPPTPWHTLYRTVDMPYPNRPDGYESLQLLINKLQNRYKYRDNGIDNNLIRTLKAYYYACVSFVDYQIGRVLQSLEQTGQLENTIILFSSDHGELLGDYGCFGKRSMHNSAAKIPLIVCGGEFDGGNVCDAPVSLIDIAPTLLRIGRATLSSHSLDGEDLRTVLYHETNRKGVYSFFSATHEVQLMCDTTQLDKLKHDKEQYIFSCINMMYAEKDFKYIYSAPDNKELLFDEVHDSKECHNKAGVPLYAEKLRYMRKELIAYLEKNGYRSLIDGERFQPLIHPEILDNPDAGLLLQDMHPDWFDFSVLKGYQNE